MLKAERGTKRTCQSCKVKFYDLNREEFECPKCGEPFIMDAKPEEEEAVVPVEEKLAVNTADAATKEVAPDVLEEDDDLDALEVDDDDDAESDDTLLAPDDDEDDDVSGLIGDIPSDDDEN